MQSIFCSCPVQAQYVRISCSFFLISDDSLSQLHYKILHTFMFVFATWRWLWPNKIVCKKLTFYSVVQSDCCYWRSGNVVVVVVMVMVTTCQCCYLTGVWFGVVSKCESGSSNHFKITNAHYDILCKIWLKLW